MLCILLEKKVWQMLIFTSRISSFFFHLSLIICVYRGTHVCIEIGGNISDGSMFFIYRTMREAEANKLKLTPQFLELKFIEAIANNSKIFFGNKVDLIFSFLIFWLFLT